MGKIRNKLLQHMLEKDGMVGVPISWQTEYVKLAGDKVRQGQVIDTIVNAYNNLLTDNLNRCSMKELRDMIKEAGGIIPKEPTRENLVQTAYLEYQMKKQ